MVVNSPAGVLTVGVDCTPVHWLRQWAHNREPWLECGEMRNRNRPRYRSLASWGTFTFTPGHSEMKPSISYEEVMVFIQSKKFFKSILYFSNIQYLSRKFKILISNFHSTVHIILLLAGDVLFKKPLSANISILIFFSKNRCLFRYQKCQKI